MALIGYIYRSIVSCAFRGGHFENGGMENEMEEIELFMFHCGKSCCV